MSLTQRPPGVQDRLPSEASAALSFQNTLTGVLTQYGYQTVETPVIEYADLFLTKSGDEAINRLFTFDLYGKQLALRSEFTAPAARLYVERFQQTPHPIRWQFNGPVFRYAAPGRNNAQQFSMIGAELIGLPGTVGDSETLRIVAQALTTAQVKGWRMAVGHVGLVGQLLDGFKLDRRTRRLLLTQVENLRRDGRGRAYVESQFDAMIALTPPPREDRITTSQRTPETTTQLADALELLLESANLGSTGTGRTNEDVARRLLTKQQRAEQRGEVMRALDFLEQISAFQGDPDSTLTGLAALIPTGHPAFTTFQDLRETLQTVQQAIPNPDQVMIQMDLVRGVNYYTGIVFEVLSENGIGIGGGGRYDELIRVLGATQDTPAIGLMFHIDHLLESLGLTIPVAPPKPTSVQVTPAAPRRVTLALPSKGALQEPTMDFLKSCDLKVVQTNPRQYTANMPALPMVDVLFQRVTDIVYKLSEGVIDLGVTGLDVVAENASEDLIVIHPNLRYGACDLVVAAPEAWIDVDTMADIVDISLDFRENKRRNLRIATKFTTLARGFLNQHGVHHFTLVQADGALEAAPTLGYADMIIDLSATGTTLRENGLKPLADGVILESTACLVANRRALQTRPEVLETAHVLLETIDAALTGRNYYQLTANIRGASAEAVAHAVASHSVTQGLQGPTVAPIYASVTGQPSDGGWYSATVIVHSKNLLEAVGHLRRIGGTQTTVIPARYVFMPESPSIQRLMAMLNP